MPDVSACAGITQYSKRKAHADSDAEDMLEDYLDCAPPPFSHAIQQKEDTDLDIEDCRDFRSEYRTLISGCFFNCRDTGAE